LKPGRYPGLRAVTAVLLVILHCNSCAGRLTVPGSGRAAALQHRSDEAPFLPQRTRQRTLTASAYPRTNSAAAKDDGISAFSLSCNAIEELAALLPTSHGGLVHLMFLLGSSYPDRAPPLLT